MCAAAWIAAAQNFLTGLPEVGRSSRLVRETRTKVPHARNRANAPVFRVSEGRTSLASSAHHAESRAGRLVLAGQVRGRGDGSCMELGAIPLHDLLRQARTFLTGAVGSTRRYACVVHRRPVEPYSSRKSRSAGVEFCAECRIVSAHTSSRRKKA